MPELPEVETVVRGLQGPLHHRTITGAEVFWENTLRTDPDEFAREIVGRRIEAVTRRAKFLYFHLSHGYALFIHLKMSGSLWVVPASEPVHRHVRAIFSLDNNHELRFQDARKFGRVYLTRQPETVIGHLGPEPLAHDFTAADFMACFERRTGRLKPLLLNQSVIAGIGNIYADESCYLSHLHPARPVNTLATTDFERLYHAIREVLEFGIMAKGASFDQVYRGGSYQNHFQAYGRTGLPCGRCGTPIKRIVLGGRGTHFCPTCQPDPTLKL